MIEEAKSAGQQKNQHQQTKVVFESEQKIEQKVENSEANAINSKKDLSKNENSEQTEVKSEVKARKDELTPQQIQIMIKKVKRFDKLKSELDALKGKNVNLIKEFQNIKTQRDLLDKEYQSAKQKNELLLNQNIKIRGELFSGNKEIESLQSKIDELKKISQNREGLEETIKQLHNIINISTKTNEQLKKNEEKFKKQEEKQRQFLKFEKDQNNSLRIQIEKLRATASQTFILKQQLVRIMSENKILKDTKQQFPFITEKCEEQVKIISDLKEKATSSQNIINQNKTLIQKLEKRINAFNEERKQVDRKNNKLKIQIEEKIGEIQALKSQLDDQKIEFDVQKKRYMTEIKSLKTELHNEHQKLKITEIQLSESRKKQKQSVKLQGVSIMSLSKEDLLNIIEQLEMKNQSLKLTLNDVAHTIQSKQKRIQQQEKAVVALVRQITKGYPTLDQSEGMHYVEKEIIEIGKQKKSDWGQIVEKVMIQNLRLKYSVTALGEQYNLQLRRQKDKI